MSIICVFVITFVVHLFYHNKGQQCQIARAMSTLLICTEFGTFIHVLWNLSVKGISLATTTSNYHRCIDNIFLSDLKVQNYLNSMLILFTLTSKSLLNLSTEIPIP